MKRATIARLVLLALLLANIASVHASYYGLLISASAPERVIPGEPLRINLLVQNLGSSAWTNRVSWAAIVTNMSSPWGTSDYSFPSSSYQPVYPRATASREIMMSTPTVPGTYSVDIYTFHDQGRRINNPWVPFQNFRAMLGSPKRITYQVVDSPPVILRHPESRVYQTGTTGFLSVNANGSLPLHFQWRLNGTNIPGATANDLFIPALKPGDQGAYTVVVRNRFGSVTSSKARLTVYCTYIVSSWPSAFPSRGGNGEIEVTTPCSWTISNPHPWITIHGSTNRLGNGIVFYTVATNNLDAERIGKLIVANQEITVRQEPDLVPRNIRGKTFNLEISGGWGLPDRGKYLLVASSSTNNLLHVVPISGPTSAKKGPYTFATIQDRWATLIHNGIQMSFTFDSPVNGTFTAISNVLSESGRFVMADSGPDFNADGFFDIVWQDNTTRRLSAWLMSGTNRLRTVSLNAGLPAPVGWKASASADFNNDGNSDVLFHGASSSLWVWLMNRTNAMGVVQLRPGHVTGMDQTVVASTDFNGDNQPDVLMQSDSGAMTLWTFSRTNYLNTARIRAGQAAGLGWKAVAAADFNRDRQTDILFQHDNGGLAVWLMSGVTFSSSVGFNGAPAMASTWRVIGAADFDYDGEPDILWRNNTGEMRVWRMRNRLYLGTIILPAIPSSTGLNCVSPK